MRPIHRTRRRAFEVDAFAVVPAAVARALELVFAGFPVRGAAQMGAARIDYKNAVGCAIHPDAIFLLKLSVHSQAVLLGVADLETGRRLEQCPRQEEAKESQQPSR